MLQRRSLCLDPRERALDVAVSNTEVADISEIQALHFGPGRRVVTVDEHPARLADRCRSKPRPGPVRGAEIEWDPGDTDCRVGTRAFDAEKGRPDGESRDRGHDLLSGEAMTRWKGRLDALEHRGDALTDADAHRHQRVVAAGALQLARRRQRDARP